MRRDFNGFISQRKTGEGQQVDVSMVDTLFSLLENAIVITTMKNVIPQRQGNIDPSIAPLTSMRQRTDLYQ